VPRADLDKDKGNLEVLERLDNRFAGARPQSEKDGWKAGVSGVLSAALTWAAGLPGVPAQGQFKSLKFLEPSQVHGSIDDLVGMDDIKAEVAQIKDQYQRRAEYAEYGINKPFNVMFSGPAGTGKTKLASYLAKELTCPSCSIRRPTGNRLCRGRLEHVVAHRFHGQAAQALHRVPGRSARPVHEARGHRKFDDDTQNTLLAGAGRRAHQERGRDHLDRRQQLQQRVHADGRGDAAAASR
jgi:cell division protease FtsH